jgi:hypothetical protein
MSRALDLQRAQNTIKRRSWTTVPIPDDEFLVGKYSQILTCTHSIGRIIFSLLVQKANSLTLVIVAVHELFVAIQEARSRGTHITPQGTAFLSDLTGSVLRYLGPTERDTDNDFTTAHGTLDS